MATYSCAAGYSLNGNAERLCNSDGTWNLTEPTCTCESPSSLLNGLVTDDGETVSYTCNQGYSMDGLSTRTCGTDGSGWSGSAPTCGTCATLSSPSGGSVVLSTDGINTQAEYTCNIGYTLNGVALITCRSDGTWDFTEPTCAQCPDLSDPDSGTLTLTSTDSVTTATFTCQSDYYLKGEFSIICGTDGTWSDDAPSCECNFPAQPSNGQVSLSGTGTVATYMCDTGYTLNGLSARTCQTDGTGWEGTEPECTLCQTISNPSSGSFSLSTNGTHTTADYACAVGTSLSGDSEIMCSADGSWVSPSPTCVDCLDLSDPDSGSVSLTTDGLSTTATFSCVTGYAINSTAVLSCTSAGIWDLPSPFCICQSPPLISNGQFNISSDLRTVTYTCSVRYVLVGSDTRTCQNDGTGWDGISPVCDTTEPDTGASVDGTTLKIPIAAMISFLLLFVSLVILLVGLIILYCKLKNKKSKIESAVPTQPDISTVLCPSLAAPSSGTVTLSTSGTQTMATYSCATGYSLNGNAQRLCNSDGTWNLTEPTCTCESPSSPMNGLVTHDGETASYTCNQGYSMDGLSTRTCGTDGSGWSGSAPTCSTCGTLSSPSGGSVVLSTDGMNTQAEYTCNTGYTLNGVALITCRSDGTWDFIATTCAKCPDLSDPDSGTLTLTTTGVITTATFTCQSGYYLKGEFSISCDSNGTWSDDAPSCQCNFPAQPSNGQVSLSETGTVATYMCDTGYTLNGLSARTCQTDGTGWEGTEPECTLCQTVSNPSSGSFSLSTNGTHTTADYSCAVGTSLSGSSEIICNADGLWVSPPPACVQCPDLSDPDGGSVSLTTDGLSTTATFSCVTGYSINSTGVLSCTSSGIWDLPSPFCICQSPPLISNGQFNISSDLRTTTYTCNVGYVLVGSETRTCQNDGTGWDGISPVCDSAEPDTGAPEDGMTWKIPIAAMISFLLLFVGLVIFLVGWIYMYCRLKNQKSKIEIEAAVPTQPDILTAETPEELPEPKPTEAKATLLKKYQHAESRPGSSLTTSSLIFANGIPAPAKEVTGKVQLPPISHVITEKRGKRKIRTDKVKKTNKENIRRGTGLGEATKKNIEKEEDITRAKTPELLFAAEFNYIQPVYSYDLETQANTGRESVLSRKGEQMKQRKRKTKDKVVNYDHKK